MLNVKVDITLLKTVSVVILTMGLLSCGNDSSSLSTKSPDSTFIIPSSIQSCLNRKQGLIDKDIASAYFQVPNFTISWPNANEDLYLSFIRIYTEAGSDPAISCVISGDALAASYSSWYSSATREAVIPAGTTITLDCPLSCGGISVKGATSLSLTIEAVGFSQVGTSTDNRTPQRSFSNINVISPF